ncbi:MAG: prophage maintenance system killer protein [Cyclobacteriaceae bacterium]|jgi:prophage maintenance system killer protein
MMSKLIKAKRKIQILPQPTDESCGPTCLQSVYQYHGLDISLPQLLKEVKEVKGGGTLAVMMGNHALAHGFDATIYSYNLQMFDPTWFEKSTDLALKLSEQRVYKTSNKFRQATDAYLTFLSLGGSIRFQELNRNLLTRYLESGMPILAGLSATYLYQSAREIPKYNIYHDTKGEPAGHFVVLSSLSGEDILIADPLNPNPISMEEQYYKIPIRRVIHAILLGMITYDANLLIITPKSA